MTKPKLLRREHDRMRRRLALDLQARTRILPDVSPRRPAEPSRFRSPIADALDAYRQTPEAWRAVWEDDTNERSTR